ncbi:MAG: YgfZ/GcvT domain-containing protein, partial [Myxococcales bacterium]
MASQLPLHTLHERLGARFGERSGHAVVAHYGDPSAEYRAIREGAAVLDRSLRGKLKITGSERETYLQGMVTNDVVKPPVGAGAYATMVNVKGRMVADVRVLKRQDELLLDLEPGRAEPASEFLNKYLISEDAEIHDVTGEVAVLSFFGPDAVARLSALLGGPLPGLEENQFVERPLPSGTALVVGTRLVGTPGYDVLLPVSGAAAFVEQALAAGVRPAGVEAFDIARVEAGVPQFGVDMTEETIPLEANLER